MLTKLYNSKISKLYNSKNGTQAIVFLAYFDEIWLCFQFTSVCALELVVQTITE